MEPAPIINMHKLKADMAKAVERTSGRKFSLLVSGGKNTDVYRNLMNNGQDKRVSADVFLGIVNALGKSPFDYVYGMNEKLALPSASVLTTTFAVLLDSVGIDPYEDGRAQKLAAQFPSALRSILDLQAGSAADEGLSYGETTTAGGKGQPSE